MDEQYIIVDTKLGSLRGHVRQSILTEKNIYSFQGIPYGIPPVGNLRFKAPQPIDAWEGVQDAIKDGNNCMQEKSVWAVQQDESENSFVLGDEDCLYLNVYINKVPCSTRPSQPVMVYIHGGGFAGGSAGSRLCGPEFILEEDVVLVTISYRCGSFGFLSLGTEEVPGNAGMKDQVLALRWVRDNIHSFGGDFSNVTLFGISAGGASVQYHLLSPRSRGLFHKAIIQSGSALNPWALQREPTAIALQLAVILGCSQTDPEKVLMFLQSVPASDIVLAQKKMAEDENSKGFMGLIFAPCVETSGTEPFLTDYPQTLMEAGDFLKVPVVLGIVMQEGTVALSLQTGNNETFDRHNSKPAQYAGSIVGFRSDTEEETDVGAAITEYYSKGQPVSCDTLDDYIAICSDIIVNVGMNRTRNLLLKHSDCPVFSYFFTNHRRCLCSLYKGIFPNHEVYSRLSTTETKHGGDHLFCFAVNISETVQTSELSADDKIAIKRHVKSWTTFASVGDPNCKEAEVTWERDSEENPCYLELGEHWVLRKGIPYEERMKFWNDLCLKYPK